MRIMLMYYPDLEKLLNQPDADWKIMIAEGTDSPPDNSVNNSGGLSYTKCNTNFCLSRGWASYFMVQRTVIILNFKRKSRESVKSYRVQI